MSACLLIERSVLNSFNTSPEVDLRGRTRLENGFESRQLADQLSAKLSPSSPCSAGRLSLGGMLYAFYTSLCSAYMTDLRSLSEGFTLGALIGKRNIGEWDALLKFGDEHFPTGIPAHCNSSPAVLEDRIIDLLALQLLWNNPSCSSLKVLFPALETVTVFSKKLPETVAGYLRSLPLPPGWDESLLHLLLKPEKLFPDSLEEQIRFITGSPFYSCLGEKTAYLKALDMVNEENKFCGPGPGPVEGIDLSFIEDDTPRFSDDSDWMPQLILLAKNCYVWLYQLSEKYKREINTLNDIPGEELDELHRRGISGLWLIGLWERSPASRAIKRACGNPEAEASAYSLKNYTISDDLGGWEALINLKERCLRKGLRLASDMVPNHTGMDSEWMAEHPEYFINLPYSPFPNYTFRGANVSEDPRMEVYLEDGYYDRSDAAVVFLRRDTETGEERFVYHGNDGTTMPWNDTAQLDFMKNEVREAVIRQIIKVAEIFPIIRFDAAMTLARKHVQRLWYPKPGDGGAIPSRSEFGMSEREFLTHMPEEFWREVVERIKQEAPQTLLLAEAFWMMEGYFVRNLGMHRVYNSAFMNLLKTEENKEYRRILKETLRKDPRILKRFVNFMNNPDEDTAVSQFGKGDKYFGVCTLLVTLPGLPMIGHGQFEGLTEKYGMEYRRSYFEEQPDDSLLSRHEKEIYPLMKNRLLFAGARQFHLFDYYNRKGVDENVFAYSNSRDGHHSLILYNNSNKLTEGRILKECPKAREGGTEYSEKTIGQILGLKESGYTLLFETRKKLWYIHRNSDILKKGLPVKLYGYQSKVFFPIDIREDDGERRIEKLVLKIGSRGIPDLNRALLHSELEPLIHMMKTFFSSRIVDTPVMSDLITLLSRDLGKIRRLLGPGKGKSRRSVRKEQTVLEDIIRPSFLSLILSEPDENRLFYMSRFYQLWKEKEKLTIPEISTFWTGIMEDREFAPWFGINRYRDVLWFNKECMDEAFWWFSCLCSLEVLKHHSTRDDFKRMQDCADFLAQLQKRIAESEYRVTQILNRSK